MSYVPAFGVGDFVKIIPLEGREGRVIELIRYDDAWLFVVRYIREGDVRMMRCLVDELEPMEA
jgi:hypothetical protein